MKKILQSIKDNKAIRFNNLLNECNKVGVSLQLISKIFNITPADNRRNNFYKITIKDEDLY